MSKRIIAATFGLLFAVSAVAGTDVNNASQAELESIKGIGPAISTLVLSERKKAEFKDWNDLVARVKGVNDKTAARLSARGLTVNGAVFSRASVADKDAEPAGAAAKK